MPGEKWDSSGKEFQEYVSKLLRRRYGARDLVEIPDRDGGDGGIEAFSRDGCAYQCYAAEEPLDVRALYEKQRDKLTKDIGKFITNKDHFNSILPPTKISRWIFVVPRYESSDLIAHASTKANEVIAQNLPYVGTEFCVQVAVLDFFSVEREQIAGALESDTRLAIEAVDGAEVARWESTNDTLSSTILSKLAKLGSLSEDGRQEYTKELIRHYLQGENLLQNLRTQYPDLFKSVMQTKDARQQLLRASALRSGSNQEHLTHQITEHQRELSAILRGFSKQDVEQLVYAAIADWLMRCPLDFPIQSRS